jgi:outer membrane lipoprotein SlyB
MTTPIRNTHPMLLIAAVAVTIFSILGSATIAGFIPKANSESAQTSTASSDLASAKNDEASKKQMTPEEKQATDKPEGKVKPAANQEGITSPSKHKPTTTLANTESSSVANSTPCHSCGMIESIKLSEQEGDGSGLGVVAGGVAGGLLGNQVGKGKGNTLMTILGVGGGAFAGNEIEKKVKTTSVYKVKVHMEDGSYRTLSQTEQPDHAVGDHVKVINGHLADA